MVEVKAAGLEASFEQFDSEASVAALKDELEALKQHVAANVAGEERPALEGVKTGGESLFSATYLRQGLQPALEAKALESGGSEGGFAVPKEIDEVIETSLAAISPIRQIANVVQVGSAGYRKLVATGGTPSGWASFEGVRTETATPSFTEVVPASGELFANPAATQQMLDDAMFNVEEWLASEIATEFARAEGAAFINGTGANQPLGFLQSPTSANDDASRAVGTLQTVGTGVAGDFPASDPADVLLDLVQSLRQPYRQGASFVMNSATAAAIRKFKTADGAYIWQPSMASGQPASLFGYPVVEAEDMPDIGAGSHSIAFGNFKSGYTIADRGETLILRDPYTNKPYVHFYATERLDMAVQPVVNALPSASPPVSANPGDCFLVATGATAEWAGHDDALAMMGAGGWIYLEAFEGLSVFDASAQIIRRFVGGAWIVDPLKGALSDVNNDQVVGVRQAAVALPTGGSTKDTQARTAISDLVDRLVAHGLINVN